MQPGFEVIENGFGVLLPEGYPFFWRPSLRHLLNSIEPGDELDRFFRRRRTCAVSVWRNCTGGTRHVPVTLLRQRNAKGAVRRYA